MKKNTPKQGDKPSRPDPEFQRDDLRNQTFYHVGHEFDPHPPKRDAGNQVVRKTKPLSRKHP